MSNRFWVGGTGTWDSTTTTHWSSTTGGSGGASVPGSADVATFDSASGGGTVTVDSTIGGTTVGGITLSSFTGTLDFATNNPSFTIGAFGGLVDSGTGTHTLNMGSGTWTFTANNGNVVNITNSNLTLNANTSTIALAPSSTATQSRSFTCTATGKTFATVSVNGTNQGGTPVSFNGTFTIGTLTLLNGPWIGFTNTTTTTVTNAINYAGAAANLAVIQGGGSGTTPVLVASGGASFTWAAFARLSFAGSSGAVNPTSSFDLGGNNFNGGALSGPAVGGGGGRMIGG